MIQCEDSSRTWSNLRSSIKARLESDRHWSNGPLISTPGLEISKACCLISSLYCKLSQLNRVDGGGTYYCFTGNHRIVQLRPLGHCRQICLPVFSQIFPDTTLLAKEYQPLANCPEEIDKEGNVAHVLLIRVGFSDRQVISNGIIWGRPRQSCSVKASSM